MPFIAGAFTATLSGNAIGDVEDGFTIEYSPIKQLIRGDAYGEMAQDAVHQGLDCFLQFELLITNQTSVSDHEDIIWPWVNAIAGANVMGDAGVIGALDSHSWRSIALTAVAGTPAATLTGEDVYTFPQCALAEGFPNRILLSSKLRTYPLRFRVYPDSSGVFFTRA